VYQGFKANTITRVYTLPFTPTNRLLSNQLFATLDFGGAAADTLFTIDSITIKASQPPSAAGAPVSAPAATRAAPASPASPLVQPAPQPQPSAGVVLLQQSFLPGSEQTFFPRMALNAKATYNMTSTAGAGTVLVISPANRREMYAIQILSKPVSASAHAVYTLTMEVGASVPKAPLGMGLIWDQVSPTGLDCLGTLNSNLIHVCRPSHELPIPCCA
jgi:hypothetical protein